MRARRLHGSAHLAVTAILLAGGLLAATSLVLPREQEAPKLEATSVSTVEQEGVFSSALLHVAFDESVSETEARAVAVNLGHAIDTSEFKLPRVIAYENPAATEARIERLRERPDVENVIVHDWRAEARAALEGAPPADGLCVMRTNRKNQVEVIFRSGTTEAAALASVEQTGLEFGEWDPSPQALVLRVNSASEAAPRLERERGVRWTALTTTQFALAE